MNIKLIFMNIKLKIVLFQICGQCGTGCLRHGKTPSQQKRQKNETSSVCDQKTATGLGKWDLGARERSNIFPIWIRKLILIKKVRLACLRAPRAQCY
jgi:hypothetical protein